jgi:hypothetical protein
VFSKPVSTKIIGYFTLLPAVLMLLGTVLALFLVPSFGFASGVNFVSLIPFFFLMLFSLILSSVCIYIAIRYFKNKPFKQEKTLGNLFVIFGLGYFVYSSLVCLLSNLTGNLGGFGQPLVAFLLMLILVPLGLGMKNGYK